MEDMLYIWAKEYPEYKYQQGMNEILAVIVICLASELLFEGSYESGESLLSDEGDDLSTDEVHKAF